MIDTPKAKITTTLIKAYTMMNTESAMPPNICVNKTAVAMYLATSINHFPISFFMLQRYDKFLNPPSFLATIFSNAPQLRRLCCVSKLKIAFEAVPQKQRRDKPHTYSSVFCRSESSSMHCMGVISAMLTRRMRSATACSGLLTTERADWPLITTSRQLW